MSLIIHLIQYSFHLESILSLPVSLHLCLSLCLCSCLQLDIEYNPRKISYSVFILQVYWFYCISYKFFNLRSIFVIT